MLKAVVVTGRLIGPTQIQLDEPLPFQDSTVAVIVCSTSPAASTYASQSIFDFLRTLPPGTRTREDIDRQFAADRG
jgi:hypothetical protein